MDQSCALLLYAPITKKHEFEIELTPKFSFTILPSLFATFTDPGTPGQNQKRCALRACSVAAVRCSLTPCS